MGKKKDKKNNRKKNSPLEDKIHWALGHAMAIISIILVIASFGGAYYFVISPNLVSKPFIEKPTLPDDGMSRIEAGEEVIGSEHINYLINEIGAYKLRKKFGTKDYPIMEFVLTDVNKIYYSYVKDNVPVTKKGNPKNEDIILKGSQKTVFNILKSGSVLGSVKKARDNGEIEIELVSDMKVLAAKGYLSLYDALR